MSVYDIIVEDVRIVDGTGMETSTGSIAIADGMIVNIGKITGSARRNLQGDGLTVAPGFIDIHSHGDMAITSFPRAANSLLQGVTSEVVGNCGFSVAPVGSISAADMRDFLGESVDHLTWEWNGFGEWMDAVDRLVPGVNIIPLVGHGTLRLEVMGFEARPPTPGEQAEMERHLLLALREGAWGMSSGLAYSPGTFAAPREIRDLVRHLPVESALYASHIRDESDGVIDAVEEVIDLAETTSARVHVSHLKAAGHSNWGRVPSLIGMIEAARRRGVTVSADFYPYSASSTFLSQLFPAWTQLGGPRAFLERLSKPEVRSQIRAEYEAGTGGWSELCELSEHRGWDHVLLAVVTAESMRRWEGSTIAEAAHALAVDPFEFCCDLLVADRGTTEMIFFEMSYEDVNAVASWPVSVVGSDWGAAGGEGDRCHPRAWGTFPRLLRWVREGRFDVTLPEMICRMTWLPAQLLGLADRGRIYPGLAADLVVFDPERVSDRAEYRRPAQTPDGIRHVIVNGVLSVEEGALTELSGGRVLRRGHRRKYG